MKPLPKSCTKYFSALLGTTFEYYDYSLFIFLTPLFSTIFFPQDDPMISLIKTYGLGFIGTIARPLGGYFFGRIGDKYGRRFGLFYSIMLMNTATMCMVFIPTYSQIGIYAPILLMICRLLQSFSAGGELNGAATFILEHTHKSNKGFASGMIASFTAGGNLLGAFVSLLCYSSSDPHTNWRLAYILGVFIGLIAFVIRYKTKETKEFKRNLKFQVNCKIDYRKVLAACLISGTFSSYFYFNFILMNSYIPLILDIPLTQTTFATNFSLGFYMICVVVAGRLSDKFSRKFIMVVGAFLVLAFAVPILYLIQLFGLNYLLLLRLFFIILTSLFMGPLHAELTGLFPVGLRYRLTSVCYSVGSFLFGSSTPILSIYLWKKTQIYWIPGVWLILTSIVGILAVLSCNPKKSF